MTSTNHIIQPQDRRASVRFVGEISTFCKPAVIENYEPVPAIIDDLSGGGLCLLLSEPFRPGTLLRVDWPGATPGAYYPIEVCVLRTQKSTSGVWSLGCCFVQEFADADLEAFGGRKEPGTSPDPRRWARYPCEFRAYCDWITSDRHERLPGTVLDVSPISLGVLVSKPVDAGAVLSLQLPDMKMSMLVCVARIEPRGSDWIIGCLFVRKLSETTITAKS
jgi:hypothetical protein